MIYTATLTTQDLYDEGEESSMASTENKMLMCKIQSQHSTRDAPTLYFYGGE